MRAVDLFETILPVPLKQSVRTWMINRAYRNAKGKAAEHVFTDIYKENGWSGEQSLSGPGSDTLSTRSMIAKLPAFLHEHRIKTLLDVPCGAFHWMQHVDLGDCRYLGGDIVPELIAANTQRYASAQRSFQVLDIINTPVPKVDLIFCRDCFIHLSNAHILQSLHNFVASGSRYLLTTSYPGKSYNWDCATGAFRPLNLELAPYRLPKPIGVIHDDPPVPEQRGNPNFERDMALWSLDSIAMAIGHHSR